jgi:cytochrome oxidase Cu insertion factor (SCO1/SenC/PrrC family)
MTTPSQDSALDLTITRLPSINSQTQTGRLKMLVVLAMCAAPVIASYFTYYVIRPTNTKSFGELIQPAKPMPSSAALRLDGSQTSVQSLRGQWLLISIAGAQCNSQCERHLYLQRQLRETLGREKRRLDWILLVSNEAPLAPELLKRLTAPDLEGFAALRMKQSDISAWLGDDTSRLYLVDPQGDYMMRFSQNMTTEQAAKAKADLNRLLRAASFWDTPGRDNIKLEPGMGQKP